MYLRGRHLTIQTDHCCLEWLDRLKENNASLTRWSLVLQPYDLQVVYCSGKPNENVDGLLPILTDDSTHDGIDKRRDGV